jgi:two-component sensor histidine kinase
MKKAQIKPLLCCIFLVFGVIQMQANSAVDSMFAKLNNTKEQELRFVLMMKIGSELEALNIDSATKHYQQSLAEIKSWNQPKLVGKAYGNIAFGEIKKQQYKKGLITSDSALKYYRIASYDTGIAEVEYNKGLVYSIIGVSDSAILNYKRVLSFQSSIQLHNLYASSYANLGYVYERMGAYDQSIAHSLKAVELLKQNSDLNYLNSLVNLALVYANLKESEKAKKLFQEIISTNIDSFPQYKLAKYVAYENLAFYFEEHNLFDSSHYYNGLAINGYQMLGNGLKLARAEIQLASLYITEGNYLAAIDVCSNRIEKYSGVNKNEILANLYLKISQAQFGLFKKEKKATHLNQALSNNKIADNLSVDLDRLNFKLQVLKNYTQVFEALGKYDSSFVYLKSFNTIKDSLFNIEKQQAITNIDIKYKTAQKEAEIQSLNHQAELLEVNLAKTETERNNTLILVALMLILLGLSWWAYVQNIRSKKRIKRWNQDLKNKNDEISKQNDEKEMLLKEIHHRVKNNLQIISSLLELQGQNITDSQALEAVSDGQTRVKSMALIHQNLYQNQDLSKIDFKEYTQQLTKQIASVYGREKNVELVLHTKPYFFDVDTSIPLGLILNELISNAFKYAFTKQKGEITVSLTQKSEGTYMLTVSDNGIGLPTDFKIKNSSSLGLKLVSRLARQLYGRLAFRNNRGAEFTVEFKNTNARKAVE